MSFTTTDNTSAPYWGPGKWPHQNTNPVSPACSYCGAFGQHICTASWFTPSRCLSCGAVGQHECPVTWAVTFPPLPCALCGTVGEHLYSLCEQIRKDRKMSTIPSYAPSEDIQYLDDARASRDSAKRHMQRLNDAAKLHMIEADALRARALMLVDELNEEVPTPADD